MPEMVSFCGKTFRVQSLADKICIRGFRRLDRVCHLQNTRCSGGAHGGCQAGCLLYWHEAWLEPATSPNAAAYASPNFLVHISEPSTSNAHIYQCQLTEVGKLGQQIPLPGARYYLSRFLSGKLGLPQIQFLARWTVDRILLEIHQWLNHSSQPERKSEQFVAGDQVRVRSRAEILRTIDRTSGHRGLLLTADMLRYCGRNFVVTRRINSIIDESSGHLKRLKNDCYTLEGVTCSGGRLMCSREELYFWRGIWLERIKQ